MKMRSHSLRHRFVMLASATVLLSGLALLPVSTAWAQFEGPTITGDLTGDNVFGCNFTPDSTAWTVVYYGTGPISEPVSAPTDNNGCFQTHVSVDLVPGLTVKVNDGQYYGPPVKELILVQVTIDSIDPATGTVSGLAPSGRMVNLWADTGGGSGLSGSTTASFGSWTYSFGAGAITAVSNIGASVPDNDGDSTGANRRLFDGGLNAELTGDDISLWQFTPNSTTTISVKSATGALLQSAQVTTDGEGNAWYNPISRRVPNLEVGMHVLATDSPTGAVLDMRLFPITFTSFDRTTGEVQGTAPPGDYVNVSVNLAENVDSEVNMVTDDTGHWSGALTDGVPFAPMTRPTVWVSVGMSVNQGLTFKIPSLDGNVATDVLTGTDLAEITPLTVSIRTAPDGTVLYSGTVKTDNAGRFQLARKTHHVDLVPGIDITVSTGAIDREFVLNTITIDDYSGIGTAIHMAGTALANHWVIAGWYSTNVGDGQWVVASGDNAWHADLGPGQNVLGLSAAVADDNWNFTSTTLKLATKGKSR